MRKQERFRSVFVQSFAAGDAAQAAVRSLLGAGFAPSEVSVVVGASKATDRPEAESTLLVKSLEHALAGSHAVYVPGVGFVIGGPLVAGTTGKPKSRRLSQLLQDLGISAREADFYSKRAEAGEAIVVAAESPTEGPPEPVPSLEGRGGA